MDVSVSGPLEPLLAPLLREPNDASPAMICSQVFDSISIHANGDIVCWCVDVETVNEYTGMCLRTELPMFGMAQRIGRSDIGYCSRGRIAGAQRLIGIAR
jgi:hypothetical protein